MRKPWIALLLLLLPLSVWAADQPDAYRIGVDDVLQITVPVHDELDKGLDCQAVVLSDGTISYPEVGRLKVSGKTVDEVSSDIENVLGKTRRDVHVVVAVLEVHSLRARIVGAIKLGGAFDIKPGWRVMDLVALAGGLADLPQRITGRLVRPGGQLVILDVPAAVEHPDSAANVTLENDDLVILDQVEYHNQIHVLGQVARAGAVDLVPGMTALGALSEAGGPADRAALRGAYILRNGQQIPIDLYAALVEGKPGIDRPLVAGDELLVPTIRELVGVMGDVAKPGYYPVPEDPADRTVLKFLGQAGGQMPDADMRRALIIRQRGGKITTIPLDIQEILKKGLLARNSTLEPEDILYIPARHSRYNLYELAAPFVALGAVHLY